MVAAIVESLDPSVPATVYLAVEYDSDKSLLASRDNVMVHWVGGGGSPAAPGSALETGRSVPREEQGADASMAGG